MCEHLEADSHEIVSDNTPSPRQMSFVRHDKSIAVRSGGTKSHLWEVQDAASESAGPVYVIDANFAEEVVVVEH